jgi:hypothetical protein
MSHLWSGRFFFLSAALLVAVPSFADSHARIVRLSSVQGDVQVDRNTGQGYEKGFLNLPVTEGTKIQTKADGLATVELEEGSGVRIAPDSVVGFPQLALLDSGTEASTLFVQEGTVYIDFAGARDGEFTVTFGHTKVSLTDPAHLRLAMEDTVAVLSVFKGDVQVQSPSGSVEVGKNRTAIFDLADKDRYKLADGYGSGDYDAWDKQQEQYQQTYASAGSQSSNSPYAYGNSDLNYYGTFSNYPGYGTLWQPYFAGAGWNPFMNGAWTYYPGYGYGWASGYPWGWTPYHTGTWVYAPGYGWGWQPGGPWTNRNPMPRVSNPPADFQLPEPPDSGQKTVWVNHGPEPVLLGKSANHLQIANNSAGLGIPRGSVKDLGPLSQTVAQSGFAVAKLHLPLTNSSSWVYSGRVRTGSGGRSVAAHAGHVGGGMTGGHGR